MKTIKITAGLDVPIAGKPEQSVGTTPKINHVALVGDDYIGMKPTMFVSEGDRVKTGQLLFSDKKNPGVNFTAPACGEVVAINRGAKRKFESLVIRKDGDDCETIVDEIKKPGQYGQQEIIEALLKSGLWASFRSRPYGKIPPVETTPASLFINAAETTPLAPSPAVIIKLQQEEFVAGLVVLEQAIASPIHLCSLVGQEAPMPEQSRIQPWRFAGPHPAGLVSTHIHMIDPAAENHVVWHLSYQDVIAIGHLFIHGSLQTERIIALSGSAVKQPQLLKVPIGAAVGELCRDRLTDGENRVLSGSVLDGRIAADTVHGYLGRYHNQISALPDESGRSLFNWLLPGRERFSIVPVFTSALRTGARYIMPTATWGGDRAIYPLGTYEKVMPLDIIATSLLKSIAVNDTEKAKELGALELIEEDLALCSFVCPGKNDFGPMLREVLTTIEQEG